MYSTSILRPSGEPFYVCANDDFGDKSITLQILVRDSVNICLRDKFGNPSIMQTLVNNSVHMGLVSLRESIKTCKLLLFWIEEAFAMKCDDRTLRSMKMCVDATSFCYHFYLKEQVFQYHVCYPLHTRTGHCYSYPNICISMTSDKNKAGYDFNSW